MDFDDNIEEFNDFCNNILGNKKVKLDEKSKNYMKNMNLRYYSDVGQFDYFELTMDSEELKKRAISEEVMQKQILERLKEQVALKDGLFKSFDLSMDLNEYNQQMKLQEERFNCFKSSLSEEDLKQLKDKIRLQCYGFTKKDVDNCIETIKKIVFEEVGDDPYAIRFFAVPIIEDCNFYLGCIAKTNNNGTTYMFSTEKEILNTTYIKQIY